MNEELCYENYKKVEEILERYDPQLGELFHRTAKPMLERFCYARRREESDLLVDGSLVDILGLDTYEINMIPSDSKTGCNQSCIVYADGEWKNKENSFLKRSAELYSYWFECFNVNKRTLVFTHSWDEHSFNRNCRINYDNYSGNQHSVAVILITSTGPSIQYLGK